MDNSNIVACYQNTRTAMELEEIFQGTDLDAIKKSFGWIGKALKNGLNAPTQVTKTKSYLI